MSSVAEAKPPEGIDHGDHVCGVFASEGEQDQAVAAFVAAGLAAGDQVRCLTDGALTDGAPPEATLASLRRAGVATGPALASGQLAVVPLDPRAQATPEPATMAAALHAAVDRALADGWRGLRITGAAGWAGGDVPAALVVDCERRLTEVVAARPVAALCRYDRRRVDAQVLQAAVAAHPTTLAGAALRVTLLAAGPGLALEGEVDVSNREVLERALARLATAGPSVHLDLGRLRFVDVGGARAFVALAGRLPPGSRLILHDPPSLLARVLSAGWGEIPGVELVGP